MKTLLKRIFCGWLVGCLLAVSFPLFAVADDNASHDTAPQNDPMVLVTLGDSYSSGEGLGDYGNAKTIEKKVKDQDWLAHRSKNCWAGQLKLFGVDGTLSEHRNENWYFAASSGATTTHMKSKQGKAYYQKQGDLTNKSYPEKDKLVDAQLDVFKNIPKGTVDYVTVSIGGNDMGFSAAIEKAAKCVARKNAITDFLDPNGLQKLINSKFEKSGRIKEDIRNDIKQAYVDIHEAAGDQATILVVGYPTLFGADTNILNSDKGRMFVSRKECDMINGASGRFEKDLQNIVDELDDEMDIRFVSVKDKFKGHEAYTQNSYLYELYFDLIKRTDNIDRNKIYWEGICHPNECGAKVYAECVQQEINKDVKKNAKKIDLDSMEGTGYNNWGWWRLDGFDCINNPDKVGFLDLLEHRLGGPYIKTENFDGPFDQCDWPNGYECRCKCEDLQFALTEGFNWTLEHYKNQVDKWTSDDTCCLTEKDGYFYFPSTGIGNCYLFTYKECYYYQGFFYLLMDRFEWDYDHFAGSFLAKLSYKETERGKIWSLHRFTDEVIDFCGWKLKTCDLADVCDCVEDDLCITVSWTDAKADMGLSLYASSDTELTYREGKYYNAAGKVVAYDKPKEKDSDGYYCRSVQFVNEDFVCEVHTYDMNWSPDGGRGMNAVADRGASARCVRNETFLWGGEPEPHRYSTGYWDGIVCTIDRGAVVQGSGDTAHSDFHEIVEES